MAVIKIDEKINNDLKHLDGVIDYIEKQHGKLIERFDSIVKEHHLYDFFGGVIANMKNGITDPFDTDFRGFLNSLIATLPAATGSLVTAVGLKGVGGLAASEAFAAGGITAVLSALAGAWGLVVGTVAGNVGFTIYDIKTANNKLKDLSSTAKNVKIQCKSFKENLNAVSTSLSNSKYFADDASAALKSEQYTGHKKIKSRVKIRKKEVDEILERIKRLINEIDCYVAELDALTTVIG